MEMCSVSDDDGKRSDRAVDFLSGESNLIIPYTWMSVNHADIIMDHDKSNIPSDRLVG